MLNPTSSDDHHWMQFYHQVDSQDGIPPGETDQFFDAGSKPGLKVSSSSVSPRSGSGPGLSPKPVRRRSRASKRTPTRVLNANANNFRALVQQFTGCPSASITTFKGPVNLSFSNYHHPQDGAGTINTYPYNSTSTFISSSASVSSGYGHQLSAFTDPHRGNSLSPIANIAVTSSTGGLVSGFSSMESDTGTANLEGGFAGVVDGSASVQGLPTMPDTFPW